MIVYGCLCRTREGQSNAQQQQRRSTKASGMVSANVHPTNTFTTALTVIQHWLSHSCPPLCD